MRKYERLLDDPGMTVSVALEQGSLRTVCPNRFEEGLGIYRWIGDVILGHRDAVPVGPVNFRDLGTIDNLIVVPSTVPLQWCAIEKQAVYFSGDSMKKDFRGIRLNEGPGLPFPSGKRRPDYRSSGPKRLMPQLQMKVPWFRRWGKKMAVVVDEDFFREVVGEVKVVDEIPDCEVAWFVVKYGTKCELKRGSVHLTTLDDSAQSVVAGSGLGLADFEKRILSKLGRLGSGPA